MKAYLMFAHLPMTFKINNFFKKLGRKHRFLPYAILMGDFVKTFGEASMKLA